MEVIKIKWRKKTFDAEYVTTIFDGITNICDKVINVRIDCKCCPEFWAEFSLSSDNIAQLNKDKAIMKKAEGRLVHKSLPVNDLKVFIGAFDFEKMYYISFIDINNPETHVQGIIKLG